MPKALPVATWRRLDVLVRVSCYLNLSEESRGEPSLENIC